MLEYLSGLVQVHVVDFPKNMDNDALFRWMNDYCRQNPKQTIALGGFMLVGKRRAENPR